MRRNGFIIGKMLVDDQNDLNQSSYQLAPRYDHGRNKEMILESLKKTKFQFQDKKVYFDMYKDFDKVNCKF